MNLLKKNLYLKIGLKIHEYKSYNTQVKYLMKNFFYKKINIYKNNLKKTELNFDDVKQSNKVIKL